MTSRAPVGLGRGAQRHELGVDARVKVVQDGNEQERVVLQEFLDTLPSAQIRDARLHREQKEQHSGHVAHIRQIALRYVPTTTQIISSPIIVVVVVVWVLIMLVVVLRIEERCLARDFVGHDAEQIELVGENAGGAGDRDERAREI